MSDSKVQPCSSLEQSGEKPADNGCIAVKIWQCGRTVKQNEGKGLCVMARDYKGFGNQGINGVAEKIWMKLNQSD